MISDQAYENASWQTQALCAQTDPEAFFPEEGGSTRQAKKICKECEVKKECLRYALDHEITKGIWGGLAPEERRQVQLSVKEAS